MPNLWGGLIQKPSQLKSPPVKEVLLPMKKLEAEAFKKFEEDNIEYERELRKFEMRQKILEKNWQRPSTKIILQKYLMQKLTLKN